MSPLAFYNFSGKSFKLKKRSQLFFAMNDKPLPVVAVCVRNEEGSTVGINHCNTVPSPAGASVHQIPGTSRFVFAM